MRSCVFSTLVLVFLLTPVPGGSPPVKAEIIERVVSVVNERIILLSELNLRIREYLPQLARIRNPAARRRQFKLLRRRELAKLIDQILIEDEGKRRKLSVSIAEVEKAIKTVLKQNNISRKELIDTLKQEGYPFPRYRADLRRQILRLKTINLAVRSRITVSKDEVRAHYQQSVARLGVGLKLQLRQIFLRGKVSGGKVIHRHRLAAELVKRARGGASFANLARLHSDDSDTKGRGGALGMVGRGKLPALVESAVFAVKGVGKVVGPVVTDSGLYIVLIEKRQASQALPFDQVKARLKNKLFGIKAAKRTAAWVKSLRLKGLIDVRL